jgi:glutaredoxin
MPDVTITIYTTQTCPRCVRLKKVLGEHNVPYSEADMTSPESLTELRINGVFTNEAPVLQIGETFLAGEDLFRGNDVNLDALADLI